MSFRQASEEKSWRWKPNIEGYIFMTQKEIIFLHGFGVLGGLKNSKAQFFDQKFRQLKSTSFYAIDFNPTPKDFEFHTITGMVDRFRQYILEHDLDSIYLIGSSQGASVALNYASRYRIYLATDAVIFSIVIK